MSLLMIRVIFEILLDCIECFFAFFLELFSSLRYDIFLFHFYMIWSCVCTIILHILHEGAATLLVICNLFTVNFVAFEQESRMIAYLRNKASSTKPFPKALKHDWKPSTQGWWLSRIIKKVDLSRLIQIFYLWKWENFRNSVPNFLLILRYTLSSKSQNIQ